MIYKAQSTGFSAVIDVGYRLLKLESALPTYEDGSAANSSIFAGGFDPTDTEDDIKLEGDDINGVDTREDEQNAQERDDKKNNGEDDDKDAKSVKENYKKFIDKPNVVNAVKTAQALGSKASDFTKSSFAKVNAIPENRRAVVSAQMISQAADAPTSLGVHAKRFISKAGKGAGFAALTVACLPAAAAALVANDKVKKTDKKRAAEDLQRELIILDSKLEEAGNDPDLKADLLIAKRQTEAALNKIKYGLDMRGV